MMAVVALAVAVPVTLIVRDRDEESGSRAARPELRSTKVYRDLGIQLRSPKGWELKRKHGAVAYRSPDRDIAIVISSPGPVKDADAIQREALGVVQEQYRKARVIQRLKKPRLANRPASAAVMSARRPEGGDIRLLVATIRGKERAYLLEVLATGVSSLVEAQALLNTLRLKD